MPDRFIPLLKHTISEDPKGTCDLFSHKNFMYLSQVPVAHICNPSYSGGRDLEDCSWKPARANTSGDPISKKNTTKKYWWSGSRYRP
jgi:hypothetical protein